MSKQSGFSRFLILIALFVGLAITLARLILPPMPYVPLAVSSGLVIILGAYLGLDLTATLSRSFTMPKNQCETIKICKYVFSLVVLAIQAISIAFVSWYMQDTNDESIAILLACFYLIIAYWIAGRKLSKLAKDKGETKDKSKS